VPFPFGPDEQEGVRDALDDLIREFDPVRAFSPDVITASLPRLAAPVIVSPQELARLEESARRSVLLSRVRGLVEFVGAGRKLTARRNLTVADGKELVGLLGTGDEVDHRVGDRVFKTRSSTHLPGVDLAFRVALAGQFLREPGPGRVGRGSNASLLKDRPLDVVPILLIALIERVGPTTHHWADDAYGWGWFAEDLDGDLLPMLLALNVPGAWLEIDETAAAIWDDLLDAYDLDDVEPRKLEFHRDLVNHALRRAFERLEELGVVTRSGIGQRRTEWGTTEEEGGTVALSPLGSWAVNEILLRP
jgi:hypothetical protein